LTLSFFAAAWVVILTGCAATPSKTASGGGKYAFWPEPPDPPRIQYLTSLNSSSDLTKSKGGLDAMLYGKETQETLSLSKPYGVGIWDGRIYVCDIRGGGGVIVLDMKKNQTRVMGATGSNAIQKAVDIAVTPDGTKYVVDQGRSAILVFDSNERFVRAFNLREGGPVGVAAHGGQLYVSDLKAQHVKVLDRATGQVLRTIGEPGGEDGQFIGPLGLAVDDEGNLYVSDVIRCRVQKFGPDGSFILGWGQTSNLPGNFVRPKHMKTASDGITYVVDAAFNNVQLFDEEGKVMMHFGDAGQHPGAMDLPAGIAISEADVEVFGKYVHPAFEAERIIVVSNQFGPNRVAVYAMGRLKDGKTVDDLAGSRARVTAGAAPATQPSSAEDTAIPGAVAPDALNK
jgi:DNA-binding beta-propeller fold protein YncE